MASILKVDSMQGVTSAGDITITSEGGSATQSLQQGLVKAWTNFDASTTPTARDSFNISSYGDNGSGDTTINMTNSMSNGGYMIASGVNTYHGQSDFRWPTFIKGDGAVNGWSTITTGHFRVQTNQVTNGVSTADSGLVSKSVTGDLA